MNIFIDIRVCLIIFIGHKYRFTLLILLMHHTRVLKMLTQLFIPLNPRILDDTHLKRRLGGGGWLWGWPWGWGVNLPSQN